MPKAAISACVEASRAASSSKSSSSLGFEAGKPASIRCDAELVEAVRDAQLLLGGQRHALALHAVAQGGVVELDVAWPRDGDRGAAAPRPALGAGGPTVEPLAVALACARARASSNAAWTARVISPGLARRRSRGRRSRGPATSSAAVPVMNTSSAR